MEQFPTNCPFAIIRYLLPCIDKSKHLGTIIKLTASDEYALHLLTQHEDLAMLEVNNVRTLSAVEKN